MRDRPCALLGMMRSWIVAVAFVACSRAPSPSTVSGAPTVSPDDQFETDGSPSYRALVWSHTSNNERVVMYRRCELASCSEWKVDRTLWPGSRCDIEEELAKHTRHAMPAGAGW